MPLFLILLFLTIAIILIVADQKARSARRRALAEFAARQLWSFDPEDDANFAELHERFALFQKGSSKTISLTLRGTAETRFGRLAVQAGDYRYTTGNRKHRHTCRLSYVLATLPFSLPPETHLLIRGEHVGDTLTALLGFDDIDFESEEFSRQFFVKSGDRKFAYAVIHPRMMDYLLRSPCGPLEICGSEILLHGTGEPIWSVAEIAAAVDWLVAFVELWPDYLVNGSTGETAGRA